MTRAWRDEDADAAAAADDDDDAPGTGTGRGEEAETGDAEWDPAAIDAELASLAMTMTERGARDGTAGTAGDDDATGADRPGVGAWTAKVAFGAASPDEVHKRGGRRRERARRRARPRPDDSHHDSVRLFRRSRRCRRNRARASRGCS